MRIFISRIDHLLARNLYGMTRLGNYLRARPAKLDRSFRGGVRALYRGSMAALAIYISAATAARSAGSTSAANHGLRFSQALLRQEGCGSAMMVGAPPA